MRCQRTALFFLIGFIIFLLSSQLLAQTEVSLERVGRCPVAMPQDYETTCGFLLVPEDRSQPDSPMIEVAFAIIHSLDSTPEPDPIVYLAGGPGGSIIGNTARVFDWMFAPFAEHRDVILVDQRGAGFSLPSLYCTEFQDHFTAHLEVDDPVENVALGMTRLLGCQKRLSQSGVNTDAYTSAENAADLNDLRQALGYSEWNLFGISYGTRLGLTMMREYPDSIRSVILDSVYPPQADLYSEVIDNGERALRVLFADCAANARCQAAYPDLEALFINLYEQLNTEPLLVHATVPGFDDVNLAITGYRLYDWVFSWLYSVYNIERIPRNLYALSNGELTPPVRAGIEAELRRFGISWGMYYSVQCGEEVPFIPRDSFDSILARYPQLEDYLLYHVDTGESLFALCDAWNTAPPNIIENDAVVSDIPTLLLAGEYDPITPPAWTEMTGDTLANHYFYTFRGIGHGIVPSTSCGLEIAAAFIDDPQTTPDTSCIANLASPQFALPAP